MKTMTLDAAAETVSPLAPHISSKATLWTSRVMTTIPLLFVAVDGAMKFAAVPAVVEATAQLGFGPGTLPVLGALELLSVLLLCIRRTQVLGAVLLSAYLGGAVATHVRMGNPLFSHTLFPVYIAALVWGGLYLRNERVRALSPFAN